MMYISSTEDDEKKMAKLYIKELSGRRVKSQSNI